MLIINGQVINTNNNTKNSETIEEMFRKWLNNKYPMIGPGDMYYNVLRCAFYGGFNHCYCKVNELKDRDEESDNYFDQYKEEIHLFSSE